MGAVSTFQRIARQGLPFFDWVSSRLTAAPVLAVRRWSVIFWLSRMLPAEQPWPGALQRRWGRVAWSSPTPDYSFFNNRYLDFPNSTVGNIGWVEDIKILDGRIYVLVDTGLPTGNRDVRVLIFSDGGAFIDSMPAFTTGLDEVGAALVPYCYLTFVGGSRFCKLVASATYATGVGRQIITMKRFIISAIDGSLVVDNSFGVSNNGAMYQPTSDSLCDARCAPTPIRRRYIS
jgi:hypothetical protein